MSKTNKYYLMGLILVWAILVYASPLTAGGKKYSTSKPVTQEPSFEYRIGKEERQDWRHYASLSLETQLSKTFLLLLGNTFSRQFQRQKRTGLYRESDTNQTRMEIQRNFGKKNTMSLYGEYGFVDYTLTDQDNHARYKGGGSFRYWFTRLDALETDLNWEQKHFDDDLENLGNKDRIASGYIRYIRRINPRMDGFVKYRHYYSERGDTTHHVFHPSVGIDWAIAEDSRISLGAGALFNQWNNENDDEIYPFLELDIYKKFYFCHRGTIVFTAGSRYDSGDEQATSMGYNSLYEGGMQLDYQLTRRLSSQMTAEYEYQKFHEKRINRVDQEVALTAGLKWRPIEWLQIGLALKHEQIFTDSTVQEYKVNSVMIFARFLPKNPDKSKSLSG